MVLWFMGWRSLPQPGKQIQYELELPPVGVQHVFNSRPLGHDTDACVFAAEDPWFMVTRWTVMLLQLHGYIWPRHLSQIAWDPVLSQVRPNVM